MNMTDANDKIDQDNCKIDNVVSDKTKYLQFVSDLHLEFYSTKKNKDNYPKIEPVVLGKSYLALIGDIGYPHMSNMTDFLTYHSGKFEHIIWVAGNHEYYSSKKKQYSMDEIEDKIVKICSQFKNVTFLQQSTLQIGETLFVGCTLWTDVSSCGDLSFCMSDYSDIYVPSGRTRYAILTKFNGTRIVKKKFNKYKTQLDPCHIWNINRNMKEWIFQTAQNNPEKNIIVLTHHAPSTKMLNGLDGYTIFYANNLDSEIEKYYNIDYWLSGHTHLSKEEQIGYTQCMSNCMGYTGKTDNNFRPDKHICFQ